MRITGPILATLILSLPSPVLAEAPDLKTPAPVIYLADNLDEADDLGWCIDTLGRGFGENLHAHSCKPRGGDVQFTFDAASGQIRSVAFEGKCMELIAPDDPKIAFGLRDCEDGKTEQVFAFDATSGHITPGSQPGDCVAAGAAAAAGGAACAGAPGAGAAGAGSAHWWGCGTGAGWAGWTAGAACGVGAGWACGTAAGAASGCRWTRP